MKPAIALTLCLLTTSAAVAQDDDAVDEATPDDAVPRPRLTMLPTPPRVDRLPNGLTVVTVPWNTPGIVAYYTLVRVGSRDEVEAGHSGFAHLFEHMMFRGTDRFPEALYEERLQSFGADNNAYTTRDFTLYTTTVPASALSELVEIEADRFQNLAYDETQFRTETGAVLGEYNKSASSPYLVMSETLHGLAFQRHTYRHTTLGFLEDIQAMPEKLAYSRRFFSRFYTPDNCTIVAAGDVDHDALMALVSTHYGRWRGRRHRSRIRPEPEPRGGARAHVRWEGQAPPQIWLGWRTPSFDAGQRGDRRLDAIRQTAALQIVHGLAFDESSPLYQRLVVDEQKLLELSSWDGAFSVDPHLFVATATLKAGTGFDEVIDAIQAELSRYAAGEVDPARIEAVKSHVRYDLLMGLQTADDVADTVASYLAVGGDVSVMNDYLTALAAVTPADVEAVAGAFLVEGRRFVVTLAPGGTDGEPGEAETDAEERQ